MRAVVLLAVNLLAAPPAPRAQAVVVDPTGVQSGVILASESLCPDPTLRAHHDGSFENAIAWEYTGVVEPYDGAFAEAFTLEAGTIDCVSLWLTQTGLYSGQSTDVYVWDGGVADTPGNVLAMVGGVVLPDIPLWPGIGRFDIEVSLAVAHDATVGSWGNWPGGFVAYLWAIDQDGPGGHPWTHVAEGIGWPAG